MLFIDKTGRVDAERVIVKIFPNIERGPMDKVNGIVVHQTFSPTTESTFNSYRDKGANGAHFLVAKDGTIYQTASLLKSTNHVGLLKSRCIATKVCSPTELTIASSMRNQYAKLTHHERKKPWPLRYPWNTDSIGIELVGMAHSKKLPGKAKEEEVYEDVTAAQNSSLRWLVAELVGTLGISANEVYRHPQLSYKVASEASTAKW